MTVNVSRNWSWSFEISLAQKGAAVTMYSTSMYCTMCEQV